MREKGTKFTTRPLEMEEYKNIMELLKNGFKYTLEGKEKTFRPNTQIALILSLQANMGLRIGDILELKPSNFNKDKLQAGEQKTCKFQNRKVNPIVVSSIMEYALEHNINKNDKLFNITQRAVQKQLKIICDYLELENISTHSFRKLYATNQYEASNNNLELVKELLNHSSVATTQKYIRVKQSQINEASRANFKIDKASSSYHRFI